jgi:hypothetical protein
VVVASGCTIGGRFHTPTSETSAKVSVVRYTVAHPSSASQVVEQVIEPGELVRFGA